jgi:hypothetical protein
MHTKKDALIEYVEGEQRNKLLGRYGVNFERLLAEMNSLQNFDAQIDLYIANKKDLTEDEKIEVEIGMKRYLLDTKLLHTKYEFFADWMNLNNAARKYQELNPEFEMENKVYFATLLAEDINASSGYHTESDTAVILFNTELFTVILLIVDGVMKF